MMIRQTTHWLTGFIKVCIKNIPSSKEVGQTFLLSFFSVSAYMSSTNLTSLVAKVKDFPSICFILNPASWSKVSISP